MLTHVNRSLPNIWHQNLSFHYLISTYLYKITAIGGKLIKIKCQFFDLYDCNPQWELISIVVNKQSRI